MSKKISYRAVPIEKLTSTALAALRVGATKLVIAIEVAKLKMMAGFGSEDGTVARLVRFESPAQTRAFVELVVETGKMLTVPVEALMEPSGTYGDGLRLERERAVDEEPVEVQVETEVAAEPMDRRHAPALDASPATPIGAHHLLVATVDDPHGDPPDRERERVVERGPISQLERKRQHPLAHAHLGEHSQREVIGYVRHATAAAARAEAPALA